MRSRMQKYGTIGMSFLLLFSTLSLHINMHFCGDHLVGFAVGHKATTCNQGTAVSDTPARCFMAVMNCCKDLDIHLQGEKELHKNLVTDTATQVDASPMLLPTAVRWALPTARPDKNYGFTAHSPPPILRDVQLFYGVFLI